MMGERRGTESDNISMVLFGTDWYLKAGGSRACRKKALIPML